jgi:hypothetical protein
LELTDALIEGAIDSITGFITAAAAQEFDKPIAEVMELFLLSDTYKILSNKETGLYWDSLSETYNMFTQEMKETGHW